MDHPELVRKVVSLLSGSDINAGDITIRVPGGSSLEFTLKQIDGDIYLVFSGNKPIFSWFVFNGAINGLTICEKGVKIDVQGLPAAVDPFKSWKELAKG